MADRPILFSAPMVLALLDGRKTQTRRSLGQYDVLKDFEGKELPISCLHVEGEDLPRVTIGNVITARKLKAAVGDRLWVREAHALVGSVDPQWVLYRSSGYENECARHGFDKPYPPETEARWRPSIHMPRRASRLTLTVTEVRVERLKDISEVDAIAEGIRMNPVQDGTWMHYPEGSSAAGWDSPIISYKSLWNSINGPNSWNENPWVAAYTFTVERRNIDEANT